MLRLCMVLSWIAVGLVFICNKNTHLSQKVVYCKTCLHFFKLISRLCTWTLYGRCHCRGSNWERDKHSLTVFRCYLNKKIFLFRVLCMRKRIHIVHRFEKYLLAKIKESKILWNAKNIFIGNRKTNKNIRIFILNIGYEIQYQLMQYIALHISVTRKFYIKIWKIK